MYSYHHNLLPSSFRNLFLSSNQVHHYETRLAFQYSPHFCRTNIKQFSTLYRFFASYTNHLLPDICDYLIYGRSVD